MARLRKKDRGAEAADEVEDAAPAPEADPRRNGPWDSSEKTPDEDESYLDLGPLLIRGHDDLTIQLPADGEDGEIGSVILVTEDSALELRVFAATRSGGLWDEVRTDLAEEVTRLGGESTVVDGPYGAELHIAVPATSPEGEEGLQPSRIIGIEGPRWLLRATVLGAAALDLTDDGLLMTALRDVIVARGAEPRIPREPLLLTVPEDAILLPDED
ncbi:MAG: hypothetical protein QOJ72_308 [Nocardioidaceae bacterium]|jgi:hypothetical protein|nr:hypothetical protein [Nocardioidaceae bacterium]